MPITIAAGYSDSRTTLANGELEIAGSACPVSPTCPGQLVLTSSRVCRGVVLLEQDAHGVTQLRKTEAFLARCRCSGCARRFRVLPSDILTHKTFSVPAIECVLASHATRERSLRATVDRIDGDRTPTHSTSRGWTEGLGVHVPDRRPFRLLLSHTSAKNLLAYDALLRQRVVSLERVVHHLRVVDRGTWGETRLTTRG